MKFSAILLFVLSLATTAIGYCDIENVSAETFSKMIENKNALLIDVRSPAETKVARLENAAEIDYYNESFQEKLLQLPKDKILLLYCRSGNRSGKAAAFLESKGYPRLVNLAGGINAWQKAGLPVTSN